MLHSVIPERAITCVTRPAMSQCDYGRVRARAPDRPVGSRTHQPLLPQRLVRKRRRAARTGCDRGIAAGRWLPRGFSTNSDDRTVATGSVVVREYGVIWLGFLVDATHVVA